MHRQTAKLSQNVNNTDKTEPPILTHSFAQHTQTCQQLINGGLIQNLFRPTDFKNRLFEFACVFPKIKCMCAGVRLCRSAPLFTVKFQKKNLKKKLSLVPIVSFK